MAVKQLNMAGVRVFAYLTDTEIRLGSPIDALIVQVQAFGAAIERQKAGQRTYDALVRKAKAGHVTGGQCFGYDNVRVNGHVERRINEPQAAVIRRIFELCAAGHGQIAIAHQLNEGAGHCSPRTTEAARGVGIEHRPRSPPPSALSRRHRLQPIEKAQRVGTGEDASPPRERVDLCSSS
jgi:DNA invertase Pin-like site-specific DNA recombinase